MGIVQPILSFRTNVRNLPANKDIMLHHKISPAVEMTEKIWGLNYYRKSAICNSRRGFTLLELIIVMFLITLILGLSTVFFANTLPSSKFNATAREIAATIRHAGHLAQSNGERQTVTIDLDSRKYGIEGRGEKNIPSDVNIKVIDHLSGEISSGKYRLVFYAIGGAEGGTIVLWNKKKTVNINIDPIVGAVVTK